MPLNAVQLFVKSQLDGLVLPLTHQAPVQAFIMPPPEQELLQSPVVFVWGAVAHEQRQTMARGSNKRIDYQLDLWIYYAEEVDDNSTTDSNFPVVLDAITKKLRFLVLPQTISDSVTGERSDILSCGEDIKTDYAPAQAASAQSNLILYLARMVLDIMERVTG
jgi:hypothetical protein